MRFQLLAASLVAAAACGPAIAVGVNEIGLSADQIRSLNAQLTAPAAAPGIAFGSPVAYGADWGELFGGIGGQTVPPGGQHSVDGSLLLGLGVGDSSRTVGLEVSATIISLTGSFGDSGAFNAKVHRSLSGRASIALGVEGLEGWGDASSQDASTYAVYTQAFDLAPQSSRLPTPLVLNVGVGNERFTEPGKGGVGLFGSVSIHPHRQLSAIVDYTGVDLNAALSIVPLRQYPVVLTAGMINLTNRFGRDSEFAGGLGFLHQF
jgi:hypothetical protein